MLEVCSAARREQPVHATGSAVLAWWTGLKLSRIAQTVGLIPALNPEPLITTARMEAAAQGRFDTQLEQIARATPPITARVTGCVSSGVASRVNLTLHSWGGCVGRSRLNGRCG